MPIHEKFKRDLETNKVIKDENGDPVILVEGIDYGKFPANFIAETKEEANNLYKKYLKTMQFLANKYSMISGLDIEDLVQEGTIGLARASRDFKECRSNDFNTFAIYKIKDAMREFVTSQAVNTKVPQYIKDTARLIKRLRKIIGTIEAVETYSPMDIWWISKKYEENKEVTSNVARIRKSLFNLAERSCTTVEQLVERAEFMPLVDIEITDYNSVDLSENNEKAVIEYLINRRGISEIKELISKEDFDLIVSYFVEEKTVRELEKEVGLKGPTISVRINKIIEKLKKDLTLDGNDTNENFEEIGQGDPS